jgi:hypothetical protein
MRKFNMNDKVKVKLTPRGIAEMKRLHDELRKIAPSVGEFKEPVKDKEGYSTHQAWCLFSDLGHLMVMGFELPFETDILIEGDA